MMKLNDRYLLTTAIAGLSMLAGCYGGGATVTSATTTTIGLSGTVSGVTASASISAVKSLGTKAATDIAGSGLTVACGTLDGTQLGTTISNAAGTFSINADVDLLKPSSATGTSYSADIICSAKDSSGNVDYKTVYTFAIEEGTTTDVSVGAIDVDSTLAAASLGGDMGCGLEVGSKCTKPTGMDLQCARSGLGATWSQTSSTNTGDVAYLVGTLRTHIRNLYSSGITWTSLQCNAAAICIKQFTDCTMSDADLAIVFAALKRISPDAISSDFATNKTPWSAACAATAALHNIISTNLAGSTDSTTTCSALAAGGDTFAKVFTQSFLAVAAADVSKLSTLFPPKVMSFVGSVIKNSSGSDLSGAGRTMLSYIENQMDTHSNFESLPTQTSEFSFLGNVVKQSVGMSSTQQESYATGWFKTIETNGLNAFCTGDACRDTTTVGLIGVVGSTFLQPTFNPNSHNYGGDSSLFTQAPTLANGDKATILACHSILDMTARINCFHGLNGTIGTAGATPAPPVTVAPTTPTPDPVVPDPVVLTPDAYFDGTWTTNGCLGGSVTVATGAGGGITFTGHSGGTCTAYNNSNVLLSCTYTPGASSPTAITISGTCALTVPPPPPPQLDGYWNGTWYSSNPTCIPNISVTNLLATTTGGSPTAVGRLAAPSGQTGAGTCTMYNNGTPNVAATGCGYSGGGTATLSSANTVISVTGFTGQSGACSANLTKTPHTYFDTTWFADNIACYAPISYVLANGSSPEGLTISTHNNGSCTANMSGQSIGCTYVANTSITIVKPDNCTTVLTTVPPSPSSFYFDGMWVHTQEGMFNCSTQSGLMFNGTWSSDTGLIIQFSPPNVFEMSGGAPYSVAAGGVGGAMYQYTRFSNTPVQSVESGTMIITQDIMTDANGMCMLRLTRQ